MRVYIDWSYKLQPKQNHTWIASDLNSSDVVITVNNVNSHQNKKCVNWLYEPISIIRRAYENAAHTNNTVATHSTDVKFKKQITIPPCFPSWIAEGDTAIHNKNKLISMIASKKQMCDGHSFRQQVAEKNKTMLDLFGFGRPNELINKIDGLRDYMFSVAMENVVSDVYYTEKLLDCFLTGTIPIYWGTNKITKIFDENGIIFLNNNGEMPNITEELYYSKIESVKRNFDIAKKVNYTSSDGIQFIVDQL